ncbi:methylenetetrahydrofolate reductase-domain-containing protein [Halteromyces radiatus]|uniref:methylenetetrahydrofolate reductase-domain-containing protein n=1 Tax=Halteromyces radiatus TaxID=101107 RepID=UPI002220BCF8|nr:methylenetetrahydrofolate reductase-domain-containing protein [Halteromyces radiatus]KAI8097425.1 methylenetetrahydrofolate reductase-domain-containing protein [Halteromyces radiatus]
MKIVEKFNKAQQERSLSYSFEYFPPKTELGLANLFDRMSRMCQWEPAFISCTWGAGGSSQERTMAVCSTGQIVNGVETLLHLTCTNMEKENIDIALKKAKETGIQNILALRGDAPRGHEYWTPIENGFNHAVDLVRYIRQNYGDYFCIGVAGYPEGHMDAVSKEQDLIHLKEKVDAGADFILTQLFYNVDTFVHWYKSCRDIGITVPIVPGIMPIPTYQNFRRMINLCKTQVPEDILHTLDRIKADDQKVKDFGVKLAVDMINQLHEEHNIYNFHLSTLNLERSTKLILHNLGLVSENSLKKQPSLSKLLAPYSTPHDDHAENWDEFPNGRYGDSRSPAFGEVTFSASQSQSTSEASRKWGYPKTEQDITTIFHQYILGRLDSLPWSEERLQTETDAIRQALAEINTRGYWTVGSQPSVNGVSSQDAVFGWGPKGGYVYQKAFLEFFVSPEKLQVILKKFKQDPWVTYYAMNRNGDLLTNVMEEQAQNAVTWGVFPGKEIVQPTLIERANFESWNEEAFGLWKEWEQQYAPDSASAALLKKVGDSYWLVNVVHNDYQLVDGLFNMILS